MKIPLTETERLLKKLDFMYNELKPEEKRKCFYYRNNIIQI